MCVELVDDNDENSGHKAAVHDFQVEECLVKAFRPYAASDLQSAYVHKYMGAPADGNGSNISYN